MTTRSPRAARRPHQLTEHGDIRIDDYYWLRERDNPEVRAYLDAENEYLRTELSHTAALQDRLYDEIKSRIKQTDMSVPYRDGDYRYYRRYEDGHEYPIYCRQLVDGVQGDSSEQIILDVNEVSLGHDFCDVGSLRVSHDMTILAYAVDTIGRREYDLRFRHLKTGEEFDDVVRAVTANMVWAADNRTVFYVRHDPTTLRAYQVFRHELGTDASKDVRVFEESDETFSCAVGLSRSKGFLFIASCQTLTTEYHYLDSSSPKDAFSVFLPRVRGHEYEVDHFLDRFYIKSNDEAKNFRLLETDDQRVGREHWTEVVAHRDDVLIEGFETFDDHLVIEERRNGLTQIRIKPWRSVDIESIGEEHEITFNEPAYDVYIDVNRNPQTTTLRFSYSSMTTPHSVYDYDMTTRERTLLKQDEVLGDFNSDRYESVRLTATTTDGTQIPISVVRRRDMHQEAPAPLLLYGYGSYGISMEPTFRSSRLSLLDRGFVFAIAHIRGGEELGRSWYEDGKLFKKKNTFTDFIVSAEHLIEIGMTASDRIFAMGGSAGGLLMGAVINMRPDLFHGVVAQVPFVDVLTTMLDDSIPLTTGEYDEWGNPNDKQYYDYIKSYSPYDNIEAVPWPHLLVMTGLHDSQVQYWEPAKWVAKRRAMVDDERRLLFQTNMDAGHGGASGRYRQYRELALQYGFLLDVAGLSDYKVST